MQPSRPKVWGTMEKKLIQVSSEGVTAPMDGSTYNDSESSIPKVTMQLSEGNLIEYGRASELVRAEVEACCIRLRLRAAPGRRTEHF